MDLQRKQAEDEIKSLNEDLERRVEVRTKELQDSLASVKQLQGLLPICAWCRKIRDDEEYWYTVEDFIATHTHARLTHGMCPACYDKATQEE